MNKIIQNAMSFGIGYFCHFYITKPVITCCDIIYEDKNKQTVCLRDCSINGVSKEEYIEKIIKQYY